MSNTPQKPRPIRKYIMIPEYRPLFAMAKVFGPTKGPLSKPTPATIPVIGELLKQSGKDKLTIFEVKKLGAGKYDDPIQLTLENYTIPYDDIVAGKTIPTAPRMEKIEQTQKPVTAKLVGLGPDKPTAPKHKVHDISDSIEVTDGIEIQHLKPAEPPKEDVTPVEPVSKELKKDAEELTAPLMVPEKEPVEAPVEETPINDTVIAESDEMKNEDVPEAETAVETPNPNKKLTKAERKALRRAERAKMGTIPEAEPDEIDKEMIEAAEAAENEE